MKVIYHDVKGRPYKEYTDEKLFNLMANKDIDYSNAKKAFAELDVRYRRYIWKVCLIYGKTQDIAKEITKETLYKAFLNASKFKKNKSVKSWLGTIAKHSIFDLKKAEKSKTPIVLDEYPDSAADQNNVDWGNRMPIEKEIFLTVWNNLENHKRDVLEAYLKYYDVNEFGDNVRLPEHEAEYLCKTYPTIIKDKYYIPKLRDRAWEELYKKCTEQNQN